MTVDELISQLRVFDGNLEVTILDGSNGGGVPRAINNKPRLSSTDEWDPDDLDDLENLWVDNIVVMGYGFY